MERGGRSESSQRSQGSSCRGNALVGTQKLHSPDLGEDLKWLPPYDAVKIISVVRKM